MDFYSHPFYVEFEKALLDSSRKNANLLILSVPGMSVTYFIKRFLEKNKSEDFGYINSKGQALTKFNILDLDFDKDSTALSLTDEYLKKAGLQQKFAVVINTPQIVETEKYKRSQLASHVYSTFYFKVLDIELIKIFAEELNSSLTAKDIEKVQDLSGGLARIAKYLILNKEKLDFPIDKLLEEPDLMSAISSTIKVLPNCYKETLETLGVIKNGNFVSLILQKYFDLNPMALKTNIKINPDLSFSENKNLSNDRLLKTEKMIIENAIENNGIISKEKIADFKWGEGSYDKYSDQAVGKTMQRLNKKLKEYTFEVIPTLGYKITLKKDD